jgi:hypothetical protein
MNGSVEVANALIQKNADVNIKHGKYSGTPLQYAASSGKAGMVKFLIESKATVGRHGFKRTHAPDLGSHERGRRDRPMKYALSGLFLSLCCSIGFTGPPLENTEHELTAVIHAEWDDMIQAVWETYRRDRVAAAGVARGGDMVELYFRESLTSGERFHDLRISIDKTVADLKVVPEPQIGQTEFRSWKFMVSRDNLDKIEFCVSSTSNTPGRGNVFRRRVFKLKTSANKTIDGN